MELGLKTRVIDRATKPKTFYDVFRRLDTIHVPSTIYANTTLRLGSIVSGTASQHMWSQQFQ